jgi:hypothetical protein
MRCESGFRPTAAQRWRAAETLRRRRESENRPPETKKEAELRLARERREHAIREEHQRRIEEEKRHVPLTAEQAAELRAAHPEIHRRSHG